MKLPVAMSQYIGNISVNDLNHLVKYLEDEGYFNFHIRVSDYDGAEIEIHYSRSETDEEYEKRTNREKKKAYKKQKAAISKKEKNRALYEKLKAEFGE